MVPRTEITAAIRRLLAFRAVYETLHQSGYAGQVQTSLDLQGLKLVDLTIVYCSHAAIPENNRLS